MGRRSKNTPVFVLLKGQCSEVVKILVSEGPDYPSSSPGFSACHLDTSFNLSAPVSASVTLEEELFHKVLFHKVVLIIWIKHQEQHLAHNKCSVLPVSLVWRTLCRCDIKRGLLGSLSSLRNSILDGPSVALRQNSTDPVS